MTEEERGAVKEGAVELNALIERLKDEPGGSAALVMLLQAKVQAAAEILVGEFQRAVTQTENLAEIITKAKETIETLEQDIEAGAGLSDRDEEMLASSIKTAATCEGRRFELLRQQKMVGALLQHLTTGIDAKEDDQ